MFHWLLVLFLSAVAIAIVFLLFLIAEKAGKLFSGSGNFKLRENREAADPELTSGGIDESLSEVSTINTY
jgi:hypothetical protein